MYAPPCSCRTGTKSIEESARDSLRSSVSSPGIPNTYLTPSDSRQSTKTSDALRSLITPPYLTALVRPLTAIRAARPTRRGLRALLSAAVLLAGFTAAARADSTFYIRGGGDGHGIGMSQYGAYGYALHGATYPALLGHYYQGPPLAPTYSRQTVRVLLATGQASFTGATGVTGSRTRLAPATTYTVTPAGGTLTIARPAGQ